MRQAFTSIEMAFGTYSRDVARVAENAQLGDLAHVDAGKTTLTERLLYDSGVIDQLGAVDAGTTQTDSLPLERRRGITIKSAVASFPIGDVAVNLIDMPGHPDFMAEVDRVLNVLDGVVLVISAVEGVQAQTRILMRSLQRLKIPALLFVNKIDRPVANPEDVLRDIASRLKVTAFAMSRVRSAGTHSASVTTSGADDDDEFTAGLTELLAERNDRLLATYVQSEAGIAYDQLRAELAEQTRRGQVYPVFFGSAITGVGIAQLMAGIAELLPTSDGDSDGPLSGSIFKIERGSRAEKIAYVRIFSGTVHVRDRLHFASGLDDKVTAVAVFERGPAVQRKAVSAGQIGMLWGLAEAQIGDRIGEWTTTLAFSFLPRPWSPPSCRVIPAIGIGCESHSASSPNRTRSSICDKTTSGRRSTCRSMALSRKRSSSPRSLTISMSPPRSARRR
jgi:ribosomal protection tetracycline resistance protein